MKKRIAMLFLALCLTVSVLTPAAYAQEAEETDAPVKTNAKSGTCGEGLSWVLDGYTLTISGSGEMEDGDPWEAHKDHIEHVVLTGGVTKIGAKAFYGYDRIETVDFGDALVEIGEKAFYGCDDIDYIHLPASFRIFGAECFRDCYSLKRVYCDGYMPRFNSSCLWTGSYVSVFYPTNNPWSAEYTAPLVSSYGGNLGVMMGNFEQSAVEAELTPAEEETEETAEEENEETTGAADAPTEEATEAAVITEAATEPVTEPADEPTEEPEVIWITAAPTEEETTEPETEPEPTTEPEPEITEQTEAPEPEPTLDGKSWIGIVMIVGVIVFLLSGAMIFRSVNKKGGRYHR